MQSPESRCCCVIDGRCCASAWFLYLPGLAVLGGTRRQACRRAVASGPGAAAGRATAPDGLALTVPGGAGLLCRHGRPWSFSQAQAALDLVEGRALGWHAAAVSWMGLRGPDLPEETRR